jgi:hypothetical protein
MVATGLGIFFSPNIRQGLFLATPTLIHPSMFFQNQYFYYITIGLQAICVIHCIRKSSQNKWIWIIVFLPVVGSIAYIFTEIFTRNKLSEVQSGFASVIKPGGNIKRLEEQLKFTDTFSNRVLLADAYFNAGQNRKAIGLYEASLTGAFAENEHVLMQLIMAYYHEERYDETIIAARKVYKRPQFARSRAHMFYALALEKEGKIEQAEMEFKSIRGKFSYYESRYEYGLFLARNEKINEAREVFKTILDEASYLNGREKNQYKGWFTKTREALQKMREQV